MSSSNKVVKSNKTWEEHADTLMQIRDMKSTGLSDRDICKGLSISHSSLQRYKSFLAEKDLDSLTTEYQNEKRCELDDQIQNVIKKVTCVERRIEEDHEEYVNLVNEVLQKEDLEDQVKIKLKRYIKFPVGDVIELRKLALQAMELRSKVWGLDRDIQNGISVETNKKLIFQINQKISTDTDKLDRIADTIIKESYKDGMQTVSEEN